jgi:hypothetical protein
MPVVLAFILSFFFISYRKINSNYFCVAFSFFIFIFLLVLSGLRFETGRDYEPYVENYEKIGTIFSPGVKESEVSFEIGFVTLQKMIKVFSTKPYLMFFIISAIILYVIIFEIYKFNDFFFLCLFGFLSKTFFYTNLCLLRQGVAIAVSLIAFRYLINKTNKRIFILLIIVASLFHQSVLLLLLFIIIPKKKSVHVFMFFFSIVICIYNYNGHNLMDYIVGITGIFSRVKYYFDRITVNANIFSLRSFYPRIMVATYFFVYRLKDDKIDRETNDLIWINLITIFLIGLLHNYGEIFIRLTLYFDLPFVFLLTKLISLKSKCPRIIRYGFMLGYYVFTFINLYRAWNPFLNPFKTIAHIYF